MTEIQTRAATVDDAEVNAQLIYMTMGTMADYLLGNDNAAQANSIILQLFQRRSSRYSYQYADLAIIDGEVVGLLLSYSGKVLKSLQFPMVKSVFAVNEFPEALRFFFRSLPLMNIKEVEADEYFINNVAVFPKFQGYGVGKFLMKLAERRAAEAGLNKCALTVEKANVRAVRLYEHLGYEIVDIVEVAWLKRRIGFSSLYRMMKVLTPSPVENTSFVSTYDDG